MANFDIAAALVLSQEGGLVTDDGGLTKYGISQRAYPSLVVSQLTEDDARRIYNSDYWCFSGLNDQILANLLLSLSVNMGKVTAIRLLQIAIGVTRDGKWGPVTEQVTNNTPNVVRELATQALLRYFALAIHDQLSVYLKGWINRVLSCIT